jgi:thymidylate kinase
LARWLFRFLPQPDFTLFLLTDAETILARKEEVPKNELERQLRAYRSLATSLGDKGVVIDVGKPAEEVVAVVIEEICRRFKARDSGGSVKTGK